MWALTCFHQRVDINKEQREILFFFSFMKMWLHHLFWSYFDVDEGLKKKWSLSIIYQHTLWENYGQILLFFTTSGPVSIKIKVYSPDKAYHICRHEARLEVRLIVSWGCCKSQLTYCIRRLVSVRGKKKHSLLHWERNSKEGFLTVY